MGRYLRRLRAHQRKRVRDFSEGRISTAIGKVPSTSPMMYEQEEVTRRFNPFDIRSYEKLRNLIDTTVFSSPSRTAIASFFLVIIFFTVTLSLPISSVTGEPAPFHHAFFTATSAVTVTGLTTVSTAAQWSVFGQVMILLACQIGGLGALTMTSLLALAIGRKMGLRSKLIAQEELSIGRLGEVGSVLRTVAYTSIGIESTIALVLTPRFLLLGENLPTSLWHGTLHIAADHATEAAHIVALHRIIAVQARRHGRLGERAELEQNHATVHATAQGMHAREVAAQRAARIDDGGGQAAMGALRDSNQDRQGIAGQDQGGETRGYLNRHDVFKKMRYQNGFPGVSERECLGGRQYFRRSKT